VGWVKAAERACSGLAAKDVDIILASGPPFSSLLLAQRLSRRLGCPYVVDYRDLWSRNLHHPVPAAIRREASVLAGSAAVTTVSPSWSLVLDREFGVGPKLHVVSNGYDSEELAKVEPHDFGHFAIVYAGVLHPPTRVISPVMAALRRLEDGAQGGPAQWKFHYYGRNQDHVLEEAERFGVRGRVIVYGNVPRSTALAAVKGAGVAVVVTSVVESVTTEDNGMVTGKIFEAIGLGTPILLIAPTGSDATSVAETAGRARSFSANDVDGIASLLRDLIRGKSLESKNPAAFAWGNIVNGLDAVLCKAIR
jgi:glycosyltransferase involved in cell wall biosynthesis